MHYLKRIITVIALFILITIISSLFLSTDLVLEKRVSVNAGKTIAEETTLKFFYSAMAGYEVQKENVSWAFNKSELGTELVSIVKIDFGFNPVSKFFGLFDKEKIEADMNRQLDGLKMEIENKPRIHQVKVQKVLNEKDMFFLSIRDTVNQFEINNVHGKLYSEINRFMDAQGTQSNEPPIVIYHFWTDTLIDIEAGIPVADSLLITEGRIKMNKIKKGYAVTAVHYGAYERLPETYFGINEWMRKNRVVVTGVPWEVYLTDPSNEANPDNWETAIYFPIE